MDREIKKFRLELEIATCQKIILQIQQEIEMLKAQLEELNGQGV